jgi:hypothetical protein
MAAQYECKWPVSIDRYRIATLPAVEGGSLLSSSPERRVIRPMSSYEDHWRYDVMAPPRSPAKDAAGISKGGEPVLFRTLADLDLTEEAVLGFANRFGMLTIPWNTPNKDEDVSTWYDWIREFRDHVDMVESGQYRTEDWAKAALNFKDNAERSVTQVLRRESDNGPITLKLELTSLRAALWTQLGLWLSNLSMPQRKCPSCGHWVTFGPGTGRRGGRAKSCGLPSCINAAYYQNPNRKGSIK